MTNKQAIKLALECIGKEMQRLAPEANLSIVLGDVDSHIKEAGKKYQKLAEASKLLEELNMEQGRLFG